MSDITFTKQSNAPPKPGTGKATAYVTTAPSLAIVDDDGTVILVAGDVVGPASVVDGNLVAFDGTSGKLLKDGLAQTGNIPTADEKTDLAAIEAAADGLFLKRVGGTVEGVTLPVFGTEFEDFEKTANASTTTTFSSYATYYSVTTADVPAGRYRVGVWFVVHHATTSTDLHWKVQVDSTDLQDEPSQLEMQDSSGTQRPYEQTFGYVTFGASGTHVIDILYARGIGSSDDALGYAARIEFVRVS